MHEYKPEEHDIKVRIHWNHFFRKLLKVNIFQKYATQRLGYYLMEKIRNVLYEDWQRFLKEAFLVNLRLTEFTQRKRKMYDLNDLSALSLFSIIIYIILLEKNFVVHILKQ